MLLAYNLDVPNESGGEFFCFGCDRWNSGQWRYFTCRKCSGIKLFSNRSYLGGHPPQLSGFVCTFHLAVLGSNPELLNRFPNEMPWPQSPKTVKVVWVLGSMPSGCWRVDAPKCYFLNILVGTKKTGLQNWFHFPLERFHQLRSRLVVGQSALQDLSFLVFRLRVEVSTTIK